MNLHTPGPYVLWDDGRTIGIEDDATGEPLAVWEVNDNDGDADPERVAADQEFAYRAITSHYTMLAALEEVTQGYGWTLLAQKKRRAVLAAIAAAKGQ